MKRYQAAQRMVQSNLWALKTLGEGRNQERLRKHLRWHLEFIDEALTNPAIARPLPLLPRW